MRVEAQRGSDAQVVEDRVDHAQIARSTLPAVVGRIEDPRALHDEARIQLASGLAESAERRTCDGARHESARCEAAQRPMRGDGLASVRSTGETHGVRRTRGIRRTARA